MDIQTKITSIVEQLTRLGKMPDWCRPVLGFPPGSFFGIYESPMVIHDRKITLISLSGVAAEVYGRHGYYITMEGNEWTLRHTDHGYISRDDDFHGIQICALFQIESEVKK